MSSGPAAGTKASEELEREFITGVLHYNMSREIVADAEDAPRRTRNVVKTFRRIERLAVAAATHDCRDRASSSHGNHGPIVGAPVAPHIAVPVSAGAAMQTAGAVTVNAIAVTGSNIEAAAKLIAA